MSDDADPPLAPGPSAGAWHPPSLEAMQALLPQYEFLSLIGQGGMGAVYKATQISLDRSVAVKVLPPGADDGEMGFTERFKVEARMMARMNHPGIVSVHDFGIAGGHLLFIVMEFVDGTDVAKMIQAQGRLEPGHALAITAHVCDALRYAHERQVVHGDIKPANVLINMEGQVKVADFGLATFNGGDQGESGVTLGTPDYAAPEIMIKGALVDGRADLYAVGVMLYNMLTGEVPHGVFQPASVKTGCDSRLDTIIHRAMEEYPERRYQTALEIRHDLDRIVAVPVAKAGSSSSPRSPVGKPAPPPKPQATSWGWTVAVVALLAVMGFVIWKNHLAPPTPAVAGVQPSAHHPVETTPRPDPAPPEGSPPRQESRPPPKPRPPGARPTASGPPAMPAPPAIETEATPHLHELEGHFQTALERDVTRVRLASIADLDTKYLAAIDRAMTAAGSSATKTDAEALRDEKQHAQDHLPLPDTDGADLAPAVKSLRETYRAAMGPIDTATQQTVAALYDRYGEVLDLYRDELAKASKTDAAHAVEVRMKEVAANRVFAMACGSTHDIEFITDAVRKEHGGTADGIVLKGDTKFQTKEAFMPPVEITVVAKTDSTNLRLGYAADQLIFNWEVNETSLRVDGGPAAKKHKEGAGKIPKDTFVTVRWVVMPGWQYVFVDGEKRYEHVGDYSHINRPVSVFPSRSTVTLKSLKVKPLRPFPAQIVKFVETPNAIWKPLRVGEMIHGDNADHVWTDIPALFDHCLYSQPFRTQSPTLKLQVLADGPVYLACTSRWGGGGSGGDWQNSIVSASQLEQQGWHRVEAGPEIKSTEPDHSWQIFSRSCKAGETFRYRTEKYLCPIVIIDDAAPAPANVLPDDGSAITEDRVLQPIEYRNKKRFAIGRHDEVDPKKMYAVKVTSVPVTRVQDSSVVVEKGTWQAEGTRFVRTRIDLFLDGVIDAKNGIFEACTVSKAGLWFLPWFSCKYKLENCIVTQSFIHKWHLVDIGVQARRCTFYGVKFEKIAYRANAAEEVKKDWLMIKNCRFVDCEIPESVLLATQDCVFEHCTFGEAENELRIQSPMEVLIYTGDADVKPATGPNRKVTVLKATKVPSPAGTTLKHNRWGNVVDFSGPPGG